MRQSAARDGVDEDAVVPITVNGGRGPMPSAPFFDDEAAFQFLFEMTCAQ